MIVAAYRRIGEAASKGRGVRLSAEECARIWGYDEAIRGAVRAEDQLREEQTDE